MKLNRTLAAVALVTCLFASGFANAQELSGPDSKSVFVKLNRSRELTGVILELADIKVETVFGEISIPVDRIDGIKMRIDAKDSAVFAIKNGDLVTGKIVLDQIQLKTSWGTANINTDSIEQITTTKNAQFFPDRSGGRDGWRFSTTASQGTSSRGTGN